MKVIRLQWLNSADKTWAMATFERDGHTVNKSFRAGNRVHPYTGEPWTKEDEQRQTVQEFQRKAREADRDLAWMRHGDAWRDHCEFGRTSFWSPLQPEELLAMLP